VNNWDGRPRATLAERFAWVAMLVGTCFGIVVLFAVLVGVGGRIICALLGLEECR
jgi:hypothetical protein